MSTTPAAGAQPRPKLTRRGFLGVVAGVGLAGSGWAVAGTLLPAEAAGETLTSNLPLPPPFQVPLPMPPVARPVEQDRYELVQRAGRVEIIPGTTTEVWGFNGMFPGPTLELRTGTPTTVRVRNELKVPTSTHLHGGVTPDTSDGYPTDLVVPEGRGFKPPPGMHGHHDPSVWTLHPGARDYTYPVVQRAATLWYHDHRMDFTAPQVWRGLAGFALVRDDEDDALPLPKGERDIPLFICDRAFEEDGSFRYPSLDPSLLVRPGVEDAYMEGVQGDVILVNGAPWPVLDVATARYRLRLLNGSNSRRYRLELTGGARFIQIGSDQGLLAAPVEHIAIAISPGERFDVVVDFSEHRPGTEITMLNTLGEGRTRDVMRFRVTSRVRDDSRIPQRLSDLPPADRSSAVTTRTFDFRRTRQTPHDMWTINGLPYRPGKPLAEPRLGTTEVWRFTSDFHHPVHLHLAHFQVLSRGTKGPEPADVGLKDTVDVRPYEVVDVLVRFEGFRGRYMIHCHNLEHEDMAMMADFQIV